MILRFYNTTLRSHAHVMRRSHGFTLIELLVVIAIIALLMGILMPALSAVRKQAWGVTCKSNLRSVGLAFNLYAQDNKYKIPRGGGGREETRWFHILLPYLAQKLPEGAGYQNVEVYDCPAYPDKDQTVCFVINAFDPDPEVERDTSEFTPIDTLRARSSTIYVADNEDGPWREIIIDRDGAGWGSTDASFERHLPGTIIRNAGLVGGSWPEQRDLNYNGCRVAHARHRHGHNALFFDWHVDYVPAEESVAENWRPKMR